jgi:hypothetical protein
MKPQNEILRHLVRSSLSPDALNFNVERRRGVFSFAAIAAQQKSS